jgi:exosortase
MRRDRFPAGALQPAWWGILFILVGAGMQLAGAYYYVRWFSGISLLPYLAGIVALMGGWPLLRWAVPGIGFLAFMVPLPWTAELMMRPQLQRISTIASAYLLQTLGLPAVAEGNIILLDDYELGVVDACSGLKMLIVFFALSTAVALLIKRPWVDRVLILVSAAPIAILSNVIRITVTGVMYETAGPKMAQLVFHDLAGWLMMPLALALMWGELSLMSLLLVDNTPAVPRPFLPVVQDVQSRRPDAPRRRTEG